jgi:zinc D-Ala-D-Ala carboxypeptidase
MGDLRKNFSRSEFVCRHCGALRGPTAALLDVLQRLRDLRGVPLVLRSAYRCPVHNRAVGGAPRSRHLAGDAADIPAGYATVAQAAAAGAVGIGSSGRWAVHVDTRPGEPARWAY